LESRGDRPGDKELDRKTAKILGDIMMYENKSMVDCLDDYIPSLLKLDLFCD